MKYYTNVTVQGNYVLYRGVNNRQRVKNRIEYSPTLFLPTNKKSSDWKTLFDEPLEPRRFNTIREARDFVKRYDEVGNFKIYGNDKYEYAFIADEFRGQIEWDINDLHIAFFDIEVGSENGFPDPYKATEPITAITIHRMNGDTVVYGCGEYTVKGKEKYIKCVDEWTLCKTFLKDWQSDCPDVISGWNIEGFDIPYIVNRFKRILGEEETQKLSPWNNVWEREFYFKGQQKKSYNISGVGILDYIELYKWYAPGGKSQESYKLDNIANVELGESKLSYDEYDNLHQLYKLNYQKFIEYNIKDVDLLIKLEDTLKLIELALTLAYDTKTNYEDVFAQTRMWDSLIYSYLIEKNIVVPPKSFQKKDAAFEGAYVKDPQIGLHNWVASFDLDSLYPHLMMNYNISPETLVEPEDYNQEMFDVIHNGVTVEKLLNKKVNTENLRHVTLTPNGQFFRTDKQGFLPKMLGEMYEDRKKFKKLMLKMKQEYENETNPQKKGEIYKLVARYNNLQLAKKVSLNSAYGAMGSQYFRFYDLRMALAVTMAGQLSIRWIETKVNAYMNKLLKSDNVDYVIASDTDSIYLRLGDLVQKVYGDKQKDMPKKKIIEFMDKVCEEKIKPYIDESYQELADYVKAFDQKMRMKREGLSDKGIWTAKKRYILNVFNNEGVEYQEPQMKVSGLELIKSSTPAIIKDKMREVMHLIMTSDENTVQKYIEVFKKEFRSLRPEDISFPRGVNGLNEYKDANNIFKKATPIHVRGALLYNDLIIKMKLDKKYPLINDGEKIKFVYLKQPNPIKENVISYTGRLPQEFGLNDFIDYELQFSKTFYDPVNQVLMCIGWSGEKCNSLDLFFK